MQVTSVPISTIEWPMRIRAIDPQRVDALKSSMEELGLINPITVYASQDGEMILAAGAHRLKAAQALKWESIDAAVMDGDDVDRQLAEIDENLCRFELSPAQRALHMSPPQGIVDGQARIRARTWLLGRAVIGGRG